MKHRSISKLLCILLVCVLLPLAALAPSRRQIGSVEITVTAPEEGAHPDYAPSMGSSDYAAADKNGTLYSET